MIPTVTDTNKPLNGTNHNKPGHYEIVTRFNQSILDPGDTLEIEIYFTGYGKIEGAKLYVSASADVFVAETSKIYQGMEIIGERLVFGAHEVSFPSSVSIISFRGMSRPAWNMTTSFFDLMLGEPPTISTECKLERAPVELKLPLRNDVRAGSYYFTFVLTYYNGNKWVSAKNMVDFSVRNLLQRNEGKTAIIAFMAASFAIITGLISLTDFKTNKIAQSLLTVKQTIGISSERINQSEELRHKELIKLLMVSGDKNNQSTEIEVVTPEDAANKSLNSTPEIGAN